MHICKLVKYYRAHYYTFFSRITESYKFKDLVFHLFFVNDHIQFRTSHFKGNIKLNKILVAVLLTHFIMLCGLNLLSQQVFSLLPVIYKWRLQRRCKCLPMLTLPFCVQNLKYNNFLRVRQFLKSYLDPESFL